ncbi:MAG: hypothetical protein JO069_21550 [Verrucomicrobia bacterium]|nr:hypothetical protein [Verrucomicrobiota bacterium]
MKVFRHGLIVAGIAFLHAAALGVSPAEPDDDVLSLQPAQGNIYHWYNLGELFAASRSFGYNHAFAEHLDEVYAPLGDLLEKVEASPETVAAFRDWLAQLKKLPWKQPFQSWPKQDQLLWQASAEQQRFSKALEQEAAKTKEGHFFYLLGARAEELAWTVPAAATRNLPVVVNGSIKRAARDFRALISDPQFEPLFGKLAPRVQAAIKRVCDLCEAEFGDEDPKQANAEPLPAEEIRQVVEAGDFIRRCAKLGALWPVPQGVTDLQAKPVAGPHGLYGDVVRIGFIRRKPA